MKINVKKTALGISLSILATFANAGYEKKNNVNNYSQEANYYCAVTAVQMYTHWVNGNTNITQDTIAADNNVSINKGMNVHEIADAIEDYTPKWFSSYSDRDDDDFIKKIISENNANQPVIVMAYTRYADTSKAPKANKHWMLVDGFRQSSSTSYEHDDAKVTGFHVNDPMWSHSKNKSKYSAYQAIDGRIAFPKTSFISDVASKYNNKYYLVRD